MYQREAGKNNLKVNVSNIWDKTSHSYTVRPHIINTIFDRPPLNCHIYSRRELQNLLQTLVMSYLHLVWFRQATPRSNITDELLRNSLFYDLPISFNFHFSSRSHYSKTHTIYSKWNSFFGSFIYLVLLKLFT